MRRKGKRRMRKCDGQEKETQQAQQAEESKSSLGQQLEWSDSVVDVEGWQPNTAREVVRCVEKHIGAEASGIIVAYLGSMFSGTVVENGDVAEFYGGATELEYLVFVTVDNHQLPVVLLTLVVCYLGYTIGPDRLYKIPFALPGMVYDWPIVHPCAVCGTCSHKCSTLRDHHCPTFRKNIALHLPICAAQHGVLLENAVISQTLLLELSLSLQTHGVLPEDAAKLLSLPAAEEMQLRLDIGELSTLELPT
jgi:hypothetical protein